MTLTIDGPRMSRTALVLFGTETGTSQDLAFEASRILERHRFAVDVDDFDNVVAQSLHQYDLVVFVLATTGQGEFPSNARKFWTSLLRKKLTSTFLAGVTYALVGLGDTSYPKFNFAARKLKKRIEQLGAVGFLEPCEADEQGEDSTDGAFIAWSRSFELKLLDSFPLSEGVKPIAETESLPSRWVLTLGEPNGVNGDSGVQDVVSNPSLKPDEFPFKVTLQQNDRVTPTDHWQDVRLWRLKASRDIEYLPGDALAIRPKNLVKDVDEIIKLMQWEAVADKRLHFHSTRNSVNVQRLPDPSLSRYQSYTLREILTNNFDIKAIPRRSFFATIARFTNDEMHKERLLEFTDPQYLDEYYDYATRPRRSILEILQEFDSVKIPWEEVINVLPVLRPRQFSIASGGALKEGGSTFELLVAIVKYRTVIKRIREGVCTSYMARLPVGSTLEVVLKTEGRFHKREQLPVTKHLLVGAGTGIAPLRAIVHEKTHSPTSTSLIFGCRNAKSDYFFKHEWEDMELQSPSNRFRVLTAFSRDQKQKVYVQDKIRENGPLVRKHLLDPNSTAIVCGSSGAMPKAIRQAMVDVLCSEVADLDSYKAMSQEEAEQYLTRMEKEGRYKQETW